MKKSIKLLLLFFFSILTTTTIAFGYPIVTQQGTTIQLVNDGSVGTALGKVAVFTTSSPVKAMVAPAGTTSGIIGIVAAGAGTTGSALIQTAGAVNCVFDGPTVAGDFVIPSTTTDGLCHDSGTTVGSTTIGTVSTTNSASGTYTVYLYQFAPTGGSVPINLAPNQTNSYNAQTFRFTNVGCPTTTNDTDVEGCARGAVTPAPDTATNLTANGAISITGASTSTASSVNKTSVGNIIDPTDPFYGAVNSNQTASCTGTLGNPVVTCTGGDFAINNGIAIAQAGSVPSISPPGAITVTNVTRAWYETGTVPGGGGTVTVAHAANFLNDFGTTYGSAPINNIMPELPFAYGAGTGKYTQSAGVYTYAVGDQNQPVNILYEWNDTTGVTSHTYDCAAFDSTYGLTAKATATTTTSAATLSSLHLNRLSCGPVVGAVGYAFWKDGAWLGSTDAATTLSVSGATNATPIVVTTTTNHGLQPGAIVTIANVTGNTAANGTWVVLKNPSPTPTTFAIATTGSGAYAGGGTVTAGGTFDDYATTMAQSARKPWFWPSVAPASAIGGPLIGSTSTSSVTISNIVGTSFTLSAAPASSFTAQTALHDNTGAFTAAINAAEAIASGSAAVGTNLRFPPGFYYGNILLTTHVGLQGPNMTFASSGVLPTVITTVRPGQPVIETPVSTNWAGGIRGLKVIGFGDGGLSDRGILIHNVAHANVIEDDLISQNGDQCVKTTGTGSENLYIRHNNIGLCVLNRNRITYTGSLELIAADDYVVDNELGTSSNIEAHVSSPALFVDGFAYIMAPAGTQTSGGGWIYSNDFEFSDINLLLMGSSSSRYQENRIDFAFGHGMMIAPALVSSNGSNQFIGNTFSNESQDASPTGVFDLVHITGDILHGSLGALFRNNHFQPRTSGNIERHAIWDSISTATGRFRTNYAGNGASVATIESLFQFNPSNGNSQGAAILGPNVNSFNSVSYAGNATPDVQLMDKIIPTNVAPTTITNFCNGPAIGGVCQPEASGRLLYVLGDINTTIADCASATYGCIKTRTGADEVLSDLKWHVFLEKTGIWQEVTSLTESTPLQLSGALGGLASTAAATLLQNCTTMNGKGKFTLLTITNDLNGGTCTTAPTYNIRNNTAATTGTALAGSTTAGQVTQAESLAYSAGDQVCLVRTVNGGTCTTPVFSVAAQVLEY